MSKLTVVCLHKPNGEHYRLSGIGNAFRALGHNFLFWDNKTTPIMDVFDIYKPDIFIGTTFDLDRSWINAFKEYPNTKIVLKGGNWGKDDDKIDKQKYPILFVTNKEKRVFSELKNSIGKPDLVMCHYHPNKVDETMSEWNSIGITPIGIMNAADSTIYTKGEINPLFKSDVSFVGGYWPYKSQNLDKYIIPLCYGNKVNIKIFGNQRWPVANYCGLIQDKDVKDLYASSTVCVNVSEPHAVDLGFDMCERPFQIIASGGFLLMDNVDTAIKDVFQDTVPYYQDVLDYGIKLKQYISNPSLRPDMTQAQKLIAENHTYINRVKYLLEKLCL